MTTRTTVEPTARNAAPEYRWRRVVALAAAAVFMLLVLAATSVVLMVRHEAERVDRRTALLAKEPSPTDLSLTESDDWWRGEQFPVIWIEPAGGAEPVLPPGMPGLPAPGQAVVSPALDRLAASNPDLARRYPDRLVLESRGVWSGDELLAYVRMPEGRTLSGQLAGNLGTDNPAVRARAFGPPTGGAHYPIGPFSGLVPVGAAVKNAILLLGVPGLVVLAVGLAAAGRARYRHSETSRWSALEALVSAIPGLVGVTVLWGLVSPRLEQVPLVGHNVLPGDLKVPWWLLATELAACVAITALVAIVISASRAIYRRHGTVWSRLESRRAVLALLQAAPLGIALAALVLGIADVFVNVLTIVGIIVAVGGVSLILPDVMRSVGATLGGFKSVPAQVVGRDLERDPDRAARPFLGAAALVVVVLSGSGVIATARHPEAFPPSAAQTQAVFVQWLDPHPGDLDRLASVFGAGLTVPFSEGGHAHEHANGHAHEHADAPAVGVTCRQLAGYFPGTECSPDAPYKLPDWTEHALTKMLSSATHGSKSDVQLAPRDEVLGSGGHALVLDEARLKALEGRVRGSAMLVLPAPYVYAGSYPARESPLATWVASGIVVAMLSLTVGYLLSLVGRLLAAREHRNPSDPGVFPRRRAAWQFAAPYGAAIIVGFLAGLAICMLMVAVFPETPMPWRGIGVTSVVAVIVGLLGTAAAASRA